MQIFLKYMSQSMLDTENILQNILQNILHVELEYAKYAKQNMHKVCKKMQYMQQNMQQICNTYIYI